MRLIAWNLAVSLCVQCLTSFYIPACSNRWGSVKISFLNLMWKRPSRNVGWDFLIGCDVLVLLIVTSLAARGPESPLLKVRPLGGRDILTLVGAICWTSMEEPAARGQWSFFQFFPCFEQPSWRLEFRGKEVENRPWLARYIQFRFLAARGLLWLNRLTFPAVPTEFVGQGAQ